MNPEKIKENEVHHEEIASYFLHKALRETWKEIDSDYIEGESEYFLDEQTSMDILIKRLRGHVSGNLMLAHSESLRPETSTEDLLREYDGVLTDELLFNEIMDYRELKKRGDKLSEGEIVKPGTRGIQ